MKRKSYSKKLKIWITCRAIKDQETTNRIVSGCGMYPNQIGSRNKRLQFDEEVFRQ
ncbi:MAG: hypothetical protein IEMM0003_0871 [bacterium]|nr:MAG: hypothetical protein IEMM0003_0871 [bacterium]